MRPKQFQPPGEDTGHLGQPRCLACVWLRCPGAGADGNHRFLTSANTPLVQKQTPRYPGTRGTPPVSKMYNSILPPSTLPRARAETSILVGVHHVPTLAMLCWLYDHIRHALSQRWLSHTPLYVNDDSVYRALRALGG